MRAPIGCPFYFEVVVMSVMLDDPEIRKDFCDESHGLLVEMEEVLEGYEDNPNDLGKLATFGQLIDRMMGAAKNLELDTFGRYCELGKTIGYKASQSKNIALNTLAAGILIDTVDFLHQMIGAIQNGAMNPSVQDVDTFIGRLKILSEKFKHIERASVGVDESGSEADVLDDIIASLKV